jgi:hypothetical protein
MQSRKLVFLIGFIFAFSFIFEIAAHADSWNQETKITFTRPVQIPGQVLPAGTYVFKLADSDGDRNVVQIFSENQKRLYATLQTIATLREEPAGDTEITVADQGSAGPDVLLSWFYPGEDEGYMFVYPKSLRKELAQDTQQVFVGNHKSIGSSETTAAGD